ncbi:MAG: iron-containing alcohol dehydrogenase [Eubacteriales bacterium]|nr:iron-containing alcohol dehydrogenase [Eubacteriales bacterium]
MNKFYQFANKVKIVTGKDSINELAKEMVLFGARNILVVSDRNIKKLGYIDVIKKIVSTNTRLRINATYVNVPRGSSMDTIEEAYTLFKDNSCDSIIACGGGSVINTAKCLKLMVATKTKKLSQLCGTGYARKQDDIPFGVVATTVGGGSDIDETASIIDERNMTRHEFSSEIMQPDFCILDPTFVKSLPEDRFLLGGIELLINSVEAYLNKRYNPISNNYALFSIKILSNIFDDFVVSGKLDENKCIELQECSAMSGMALASSLGGLSHALTNAICACSQAYHNLVLAVVFPVCLAERLDENREDCATLLRYTVPQKEWSAIDKDKRAGYFVEKSCTFIKAVLEKYGLAHRLKDMGVERESLEHIAELACNDSVLLTSAKWYEKSDMMKILEMCW